MSESDLLFQYFLLVVSLSAKSLTASAARTILAIMRIFITLLLSVIIGCAKHSFSILQPTGLSQAITRETSATKSLDQIDYTFNQRQGKLLVTIFNSTGKPIRLTDQSSALDAAGRLTFFQGQPIRPGAEGHVSIPPPPGVDPNLRRPTAAEVPTHQPFEGGIYPDDRVIRSVENETPHFVWSSGTNVSLTLVYDVGADEPLTHTFVIRRDD